MSSSRLQWCSSISWYSSIGNYSKSSASLDNVFLFIVSIASSIVGCNDSGNFHLYQKIWKESERKWMIWKKDTLVYHIAQQSPRDVNK